MSASHQINLSRMWRVRSLDNSSTSSQKTDLEPLPIATGTIELIRKFNAPTGLDKGAVVHLKLHNFPDMIRCSLNRCELEVEPKNGVYSYRIVEILQPHNELRVIGHFSKSETEPLSAVLQID